MQQSLRTFGLNHRKRGALSQANFSTSGLLRRSRAAAERRLQELEGTIRAVEAPQLSNHPPSSATSRVQRAVQPAALAAVQRSVFLHFLE